ncbi:MAG: hypothetical protein V4696_11435 [Pseudomonadota bacterium]
MKRFALCVLAPIGLMSCTSASAASYDSSNPVHCLSIFSATSGTTRTGPLADELNARIVYIVRSNGGADWLRGITPTAQELGMSWEARSRASQDGEEVMKLFDECRSRQDSDPSFRAALPILLREGREISAGAR